MPNLWTLPRPLVLASKSQARRALLAAAGLPFEAIDAGVDERAIQADLGSGADGARVAATLARAKAAAVSAQQPGRLVVGADQTLSLDGALVSKPADRGAARRQILAMAGRTHVLHAALCLMRDGTPLAEGCAEACLTCRCFSEGFVDCYLDLAGDSVLSSVGAYAVEGLGIHLFESITGEQSTILGLPMLDLLRMLRGVGAVEV